LKGRFGIESELNVGATGDFEVRLDGRAVFSKRSLGRFPEPGEVEQLIERLLKG